MQRDLDRLEQETRDLLVVGAGINGVALARQAAARGLTVALVDQGDFGGATSANSLKILHGGVRYLQQADVPRLRQSVRARRAMLRAAPHLVAPLPCAMPTRGHLLKSRWAMRLGLLANDLLSWDRNRGVAPALHIPGGRVGPRAEWLRLAPELDDARFDGVALWHDALACNTERLGLAFVQSAAEAGAAVANHVAVTGFLREGRAVAGVRARDQLTGRALAIRARRTIVNTGPWLRETLALLDTPVTCPPYRLSLTMNLVLRRQLVSRHAVGLTAYDAAWRGGRLLFFVPWRDRTMVGTFMRLHAGSAGDLAVTAADLDNCLAAINLAHPAARVTRADIAFVHAGLLPAADRDVPPGAEPPLLNHFRIVDHGAADGVDGLISVLGVKYTTAGDVAARTLRRLGLTGRAAADDAPLPGGDDADVEALAAGVARSGLAPATALRLARHYGTRVSAVVQVGAREPGLWQPVGADSDVLGAEVAYAVREEMAVTLGDVVLRRTGLGSAGRPADATLRAVARLMAAELGWDDARTAGELAATETLPCWPRL